MFIPGELDVNKLACVCCLRRSKANSLTAKKQGWKLWLGGALCPTCIKAIELLKMKKKKSIDSRP